MESLERFRCALLWPAPSGQHGGAIAGPIRARAPEIGPDRRITHRDYPLPIRWNPAELEDGTRSRITGYEAGGLVDCPSGDSLMPLL